MSRQRAPVHRVGHVSMIRRRSLASLFREMYLALDRESRFHPFRIAVRLPSANRKLVGTRSDDTVTGFVHVAQLSRMDRYVDMRGLPGRNMHAVEATKCAIGRASQLRE